jgi:hypothetical protein
LKGQGSRREKEEGSWKRGYRFRRSRISHSCQGRRSRCRQRWWHSPDYFYFYDVEGLFEGSRRSDFLHILHFSNSCLTTTNDQRKFQLHHFTIGFQKLGICADSWFLESNGKMVQLGFSLINQPKRRCPNMSNTRSMSLRN